MASSGWLGEVVRGRRNAHSHSLLRTAAEAHDTHKQALQDCSEYQQRAEQLESRVVALTAALAAKEKLLAKQRVTHAQQDPDRLAGARRASAPQNSKTADCASRISQGVQCMCAEISGLQEQLASMTRSLQEEITCVESERYAARLAVERSARAIEEMKERTARIIEEIEASDNGAIARAIEQTEATCRQLEAVMTSATIGCMHLNCISAERCRHVAEAHASVEDGKSRIRVLEGEKSALSMTLSARMSELQVERSQITAEGKELEQQIATSEATLTTCQRVLGDLQDLVAHVLRRGCASEVANQALNAELGASKSRLAQCEASLTATNEELVQLRAGNTYCMHQLNVELNECKARLGQCEASLASKNEELVQLRAANSHETHQLVSKLERFSIRMQQKESEHAACQAEIAEQGEKLSFTQETLWKLKEANQRLISAHAPCKDRINSLTAMVSHLTDEVAARVGHEKAQALEHERQRLVMEEALDRERQQKDILHDTLARRELGPAGSGVAVAPELRRADSEGYGYDPAEDSPSKSSMPPQTSPSKPSVLPQAVSARAVSQGDGEDADTDRLKILLTKLSNGEMKTEEFKAAMASLNPQPSSPGPGRVVSSADIDIRMQELSKRCPRSGDLSDLRNRREASRQLIDASQPSKPSLAAKGNARASILQESRELCDGSTGAWAVEDKQSRSTKLISSIDSWMREGQEAKDRTAKERANESSTPTAKSVLAQVNAFFSPRKAPVGLGPSQRVDAPLGEARAAPSGDQPTPEHRALQSSASFAVTGERLWVDLDERGGSGDAGPRFFLSAGQNAGSRKEGESPRFFLDDAKKGGSSNGDVTGIGILVSAHCSRWRGLDCYAVTISQVAAKSAAERGGLQVGDILTEIDGRKLSSTAPAGGDGETTKELIRRAKELIVGPRGASLSIKGTRQHIMGPREPFQVSILR